MLELAAFFVGAIDCSHIKECMFNYKSNLVSSGRMHFIKTYYVFGAACQHSRA